ncbi:hypothetical protein A2526_05450 [candidate division WOR-1 bacterium RIFOXYD2_FULL_36_8]|uniref:Uncharacterized protein n=1 Tax=candidate division WOR-1 bacterium RIFOXYB2_FULL_36_35 TaxID=1802578 RepID=A0A1F4S8N6_UNCSA|nr:MAG: hypothetical protein A2230_07385 [candidate division WOR-1 bacterium RIFOXYA2_FULL_36_21]OGC16808.1 MAG: hypothetical protein A2290_07985 [candidate division WOR-1 bacterium RIFOXYB2_FULL_36_35]OGC19823.1 MAG: hypothetical protein A2282_01135 [candidate division WOR-1 bacterium RIFOXYA12_FULL_36_13]OGC37313.1 MAG: hypothetical protein A2526_05450 [candidate division WOR-1 bacterium RIFOXYD2_FULL_36_8]
MLRTYPVSKPSSAPATGKLFYEFLMQNIKRPAAANHEIWLSGVTDQLKHPDKFAFRGDIPTGKSLEVISIAGNPVSSPYVFTGKEDCVLVSDLSDQAKEELGISQQAPLKDKVFNSNFKPYDQLPELTRISNELAVLSVAKSISSFLAGVKGKANYSEKDVFGFLVAGLEDLSSSEMMHLLHGNHIAWATLAYIRGQGKVSGNISSEFHGQNPTDFYIKDLGTVLPTIFFALASLGSDPMFFYTKLDVEIWGAREAAEYMRQFMPEILGAKEVSGYMRQLIPASVKG